MRTFLGIGAGPIQTGIFVSGAVRGGYSRIVLADVDRDLVEAVRHAGLITVNTAGRDSIRSDTYGNVEIYNPADTGELEILTKVASEATAICTALPSTSFYSDIAPWLSAAFRSAADSRRHVYAAENSTTAADELCDRVGGFPNTYYLDTVIGKMSKVFVANETDLPPLAPGFGRGHLVEEFNDIYTASSPGIDNVGIEGLYAKPDLKPFEEAKLYGHNTSHFMLASLLNLLGCRYMDEAIRHPDLVAASLAALTDECGVALCRKHHGKDVFFERDTFQRFAKDLVDRMISPMLRDNIERVIRDPERKLGWNDRMVGAIRLCYDQNVTPSHLLATTATIARACFGTERDALADGLARLWGNAPHGEANSLIEEILRMEKPI